MVQQIGARTLSEQAYTVIRDSILRNDLLPNSPISVEELAQDLGISPTPVREALKRLQSEGLVRSEAHKGIRVAELSEVDVCDTYEVRCALEPFIARLAAATIAGDDQIRDRLQSLKRSAEMIKRSDQGSASDDSSQFEEFTRVDLALNELLLSTVSNQLMRGIFDRISNHSLRIRSFVESSFRHDARDIVQEMNDEHLEIIGALLSGDAEAAERSVLNHLHGARERTLASIRELASRDAEDEDSRA